MVRTLGMVVVLAVVLMASTAQAQFSMGEVTAATGVQGTLARSGTLNPASTIGTVKNAVNAAVATKQAQLNGATGAAPIGWGGKGGGASAWASGGKGGTGVGGWASAAGWAVASTGWATSGAGAAAWARGSWGAH